MNKGVSGRLDSVYGQCMYFGLSFSRIGADFRGIVISVFHKHALKQFKAAIVRATHRYRFSLRMQLVEGAFQRVLEYFACFYLSYICLMYVIILMCVIILIMDIFIYIYDCNNYLKSNSAIVCKRRECMFGYFVSRFEDDLSTFTITSKLNKKRSTAEVRFVYLGK